MNDFNSVHLLITLDLLIALPNIIVNGLACQATKTHVLAIAELFKSLGTIKASHVVVLNEDM